MIINTTQRFPLDHLLECSQCGVPMRLEDGPAPVYTCPGSPDQTEPCQAPALRAEDLNRHLLGQVMSAIITDSTFPGFRAEVGGVLAEAGQDPPEEDELRRNAVEPEWLLAEPEAGAVLSRFIDRIRVEPRAALVEYRLPLPQGTPLAGAVPAEYQSPRIAAGLIRTGTKNRAATHPEQPQTRLGPGDRIWCITFPAWQGQPGPNRLQGQRENPGRSAHRETQGFQWGRNRDREHGPSGSPGRVQHAR